MDTNMKVDLDDYANDIADAMGLIATIRKGVYEAKDEVEKTAWQELADIGLSNCIEKIDKVYMGLRKLGEGQT